MPISCANCWCLSRGKKLIADALSRPVGQFELESDHPALVSTIITGLAAKPRAAVPSSLLLPPPRGQM
jgi:hypothetical protein